MIFLFGQILQCDAQVSVGHLVAHFGKKADSVLGRSLSSSALEKVTHKTLSALVKQVQLSNKCM